MIRDRAGPTRGLFGRGVFLAALIRRLIISRVHRNFELQTLPALKIHEGEPIRDLLQAGGVRDWCYLDGNHRKTNCMCWGGGVGGATGRTFIGFVKCSAVVGATDSELFGGISSRTRKNKWENTSSFQ